MKFEKFDEIFTPQPFCIPQTNQMIYRPSTKESALSNLFKNICAKGLDLVVLLLLFFAFENSTKSIKYRSIQILFRVAGGLLRKWYYMEQIAYIPFALNTYNQKSKETTLMKALTNTSKIYLKRDVWWNETLRSTNSVQGCPKTVSFSLRANVILNHHARNIWVNSF